MKDDHLEELGKVNVPAASDKARQAALAAAMQAYDAAEETVAQQKNSSATQGNGFLNRLTVSAIQRMEKLMGTKSRLKTSTALASFCVLAIGGYASWAVLESMNPQMGAIRLETERKEAVAGQDDAIADSATGGKTASQNETRAVESQVRKSEEFMAPEPADRRQDLSAPADEPAPAPRIGELVNAQPEVSGGRAGGVLGALPSADGEADAAFAMRKVAPSVAPGTTVRDAIAPIDPPVIEEQTRDRIEEFASNGIKRVAEEPVSTFSADVDTASYAWVRRALKQGMLPDRDSVRIEELVNYFPYDWPGPDSAETPFKATATILPTPWNPDTRLLHIAVKGYDIAPQDRPAANLVFLIDVSGSMSEPDKLPLLKSAFKLLVEKLDPQDTVSIVTYAGNAGTVLEPTRVSEKAKILRAMDQLSPGGSTAGAAGIEQAYALAQEAFVEGGVNRVMLATDGDFNVGASDDESLKKMIEEKRRSGIFLSVFGFGQGNYNDRLMQVLAQNGNGIAAYIDTLGEAEKTLVQEASGALFPIASDVKFQIEFNPARIAEYRQIGFETRALKREDFNNDRVDAGDIGSGHSVTAIYEIVPVGSPAVSVGDLRYQPAEEGAVAHDAGGEIAFLKMRAKRPGEAKSELTEMAITDADSAGGLEAASDDVRFSVAVAGFGQKLRDLDAVAHYPWEAVEKLAATSRGADPYGYRSEFLQLVRLAKALDE
ncbi:MAG: VWA domain-containing protein [Nitratireductor sp.]|nr:VWA domain-containing protein [Nitratireductor sp.]